MSNSSLVYLACPYNHSDPAIRQARFEVVNRVAARLMCEGLHVILPISHTHPIALAGDLPRGWDYWEQYDRALLRCCGKLIVLMLNGWVHSIGVNAEIAIAQELKIPIEYI